MKTFVLTVSRVFPATHKRKGDFTYFEDKIRFGIGGYNLSNGTNGKKIHTIRANFDLWDKRIKEVRKGNAVLSVRFWSGKPYNSKQVVICELTKESGIGIQKILFDDYFYSCLTDNKRFGDIWKLVENDGLVEVDFESWFNKYDLSKPMAIIHFTNFRY